MEKKSIKIITETVGVRYYLLISQNDDILTIQVN